MPNKIKILNYLIIFLGLLDVIISKIFPNILTSIYSIFILSILFFIGFVININLHVGEKNFFNFHQPIYGSVISFLLFLVLLSVSPYTLRMSKILQQGFDILVGILLFSFIFFVYKLCNSKFDNGRDFLRSRIGGFYVNPKHPIGRIFFILMFLIPLYVILISLIKGPIPINT